MIWMEDKKVRILTYNMVQMLISQNLKDEIKNFAIFSHKVDPKTYKKYKFWGHTTKSKHFSIKKIHKNEQKLKLSELGKKDVSENFFPLDCRTRSKEQNKKRINKKSFYLKEWLISYESAIFTRKNDKFLKKRCAKVFFRFLYLF